MLPRHPGLDPGGAVLCADSVVYTGLLSRLAIKSAKLASIGKQILAKFLRRSKFNIAYGQMKRDFVNRRYMGEGDMKLTTKYAISAMLGLSLLGCSIGVKRTEGMKAYSKGDYSTAIPLLRKEIERGDVSARYSLGLAYRDGNGVAQDPVQAEILLTGAALGGDPRAVAAIRQMLENGALCPKDKTLHDLWGSLVMYRNMVYGTYELGDAPPRTLVAMSDLYAEPCPGRPIQSEAAKALRSLAGGPRHVWIYVPG